jgi:sigma-E factor negative regulatory protein RseA
MDMTIGSEGDASALENLSALSDGELDGAAVARACSAWREGAEARSAWHAWHLIGDVLRSEDLAGRPGHDAAFLISVRTRLAAEPVVVAPQSTVDAPRPAHVNAARQARWSWKAPSAVAAGFVLVAGALVATRGPQTGAPATAVADVTVTEPSQVLPPVAVPTFAAVEPKFVPRPRPGDTKLIRDSRLDRYLAAHQQFAGSSALGVPSGFLRNAAAEAPTR